MLLNVISSSDTSTLKDAVSPFSNDNACYLIVLRDDSVDWIYVMRIGFILDDNMNGIHADYFFFRWSSLLIVRYKKRENSSFSQKKFRVVKADVWKGF